MGMLHDVNSAAIALRGIGEEFARIENAPGLFPPVEMVPLASKFQRLPGPLAAILFDMDGTITQTEPLFLYGVEQVVRLATGWHTSNDWPGMEPERDYPNIVGFSTLRNLEYLHACCADAVQPALLFSNALDGLAFLHAHDSPQETVRWLDALLATYGLDPWRGYADAPAAAHRDRLVQEAVERFPLVDCALFAHLGLVIFHANYIRALEAVNRGEGAAISAAVYGDSSIPAVAPLPGVSLLCALARGWVPASESAAIAAHIATGYHAAPQVEMAITLHALCEHFSRRPVPVGLVTGSGTHEATLVLRAVFRAMADEVAAWPLTGGTKERIMQGFVCHEAFFDTLVTCDDVANGRTKPFRDPYTLALTRLGLPDREARCVIGFEDTEVGIVAQRGAGIGLPCAVPIEQTRYHDFRAASHVLTGGILDALFLHGLFLP